MIDDIPWLEVLDLELSNPIRYAVQSVERLLPNLKLCSISSDEDSDGYRAQEIIRMLQRDVVLRINLRVGLGPKRVELYYDLNSSVMF